MGQAADWRRIDKRVKVSVADYAVESGEVLTTSGLGSCLGIALYDSTVGIGGMVHPMLPSRGESSKPRERFVDSGIEEVLEVMVEQGATVETVEAKVAGGATIVGIIGDGDGSIGDRNVRRVREVLDDHGIPIVGEDVGGSCGRSMRFDTGTGRVLVSRSDDVETVL